MIKHRYMLIASVVALTLLLGLSVAVQPWVTPDIDDPGPHSWGGTVIGHRAAYELLERLHGPVERGTATPFELFSERRRVVMLDPEIWRLEVEHAHLDRMSSWIREGGELVLVTRGLDKDFYRKRKTATVEADTDSSETAEAEPESSEPDTDAEDEEEQTLEDDFDRSLPWEAPTERRILRTLIEDVAEFRLLESLGIDDLHVTPAETSQLWQSGTPDDRYMQVFRNRQLIERKPEVDASLSASGSLEWVNEGIETVRVPKGTVPRFGGRDVKRATGTILVQPHDVALPVVLEYALGEGRIVLVSEPALFNNFGLSVADNAVLAYRILAGNSGLPVVIDEFYRSGHPAQGNTLSLMLASPYWAALAGLLLATALWVWRQLVRLGPPLPDPPSERRSIIEYVDTMANLFWRGGKHVYALNVLQDGLFEELMKELHLPPGTSRERILQSVEHRDRRIASELRAIAKEITSLGHGDTRLQPAVLRQYMERLNACRLPKPARSTSPHSTNSR